MELQKTSDFTGLTEGYAASTGSTLDTGDLRRAYATIPLPHIAYVNVDKQPLFGLLTKLKRKNVDESQFKFIEKRDSFHKRYGYVVGHGPASVSITGQATIAAASLEAGDTYYWRIATDFKSAGNVGVVFDANGATRNAFLPGASGTKPEFFIPGQHIKIPMVATAGSAGQNNTNSFNVVEYVLCRIESVTARTNDVDLKTKVLVSMSAERDLAGWGVTDGSAGDTPLSTSVTAGEFAEFRIHDELERARVYVCGNSHAPGTGYPDSFKDNPYSTGYGQTQIFKASESMDGSTLATVMKYDGNEFQRQWGVISDAYNLDVENTALFGHQGTTTDGNGKTIYLTQGVVDYGLNYGNIFKLAHSSKSIDSFLDDMIIYHDVRTSMKSPNLYLVDMYTLSWFMKISGFSYNNAAAAGGAGQMSEGFMGWRDIKLAQFGKKSEAVRMFTLSLPYGQMNMIYNPHLDGTQVSIVALDLNKVWLRPLVGNGYNRDTKLYVGVQTMENSGVDGRVDVIQGELGIEINDPSAVAVWKRS